MLRPRSPATGSLGLGLPALDIRTTRIRVEVHRSARRHGVDGADIEHVVAQTVVALDEGNGEGINQVLYLGWNRSRDTLLEVVVLRFDDGRDIAIHTMKMRCQPGGEGNAQELWTIWRR